MQFHRFQVALLWCVEGLGKAVMVPAGQDIDPARVPRRAKTSARRENSSSESRRSPIPRVGRDDLHAQLGSGKPGIAKSRLQPGHELTQLGGRRRTRRRSDQPSSSTGPGRTSPESPPWQLLQDDREALGRFPQPLRQPRQRLAALHGLVQRQGRERRNPVARRARLLLHRSSVASRACAPPPQAPEDVTRVKIARLSVPAPRPAGLRPAAQRERRRNLRCRRAVLRIPTPDAACCPTS